MSDGQNEIDSVVITAVQDAFYIEYDLEKGITRTERFLDVDEALDRVSYILVFGPKDYVEAEESI
jgi:hypothetical protein